MTSPDDREEARSRHDGDGDVDDALDAIDAIDTGELTALAEMLPPVAPDPGARQQLMGSLGGGRFDRFAEAVARLLEVTRDRAKALLDAIDDPSRFVAGELAGMSIYPVNGGAGVAGAMTGFVRLPAAVEFPEHRHLGDECVLIIQGSCIDPADGTVLRPGDEMHKDAGSSHSFRVRPGPDLVYLAIVHGGIEVAGGPKTAAAPGA